ncbi:MULTISPECIES: hypothetical protein [Crocosphaera]|uniref:Uncharacterized protein n=3 Tax=Crocosphaera watsonii TaxID=263511 RepID=T2JZ57_CROWT|nr:MULTISPECIES: hypothetical protein [Crocosphaera]EHJ10244.1 hypothetical protein CWATWH0003_5002 [Crocosphaera watsonii WH 0003]NQZ65291.1 hypothetical protein [Crocosphaera sp.]CCQ53903.1 hypothetical protein CWATWH0005_212 [Crocosphaera watsonii WH 0005]CCQ71053.1 hypothetical protein CWATWH0402_3951 [Crocosphaera watsonii WH 0402]
MGEAKRRKKLDQNFGKIPSIRTSSPLNFLERILYILKKEGFILEMDDDESTEFLVAYENEKCMNAFNDFSQLVADTANGDLKSDISQQAKENNNFKLPCMELENGQYILPTDFILFVAQTPQGMERFIELTLIFEQKAREIDEQQS